MSAAQPREADRVWTLFEDGAADDRDAGHWIAVYTNLLAILEHGATVRLGDRRGGAQVELTAADVEGRLRFWSLQQVSTAS